MDSLSHWVYLVYFSEISQMKTRKVSRFFSLSLTEYSVWNFEYYLIQKSSSFLNGHWPNEAYLFLYNQNVPNLDDWNKLQELTLSI